MEHTSLPVVAAAATSAPSASTWDTLRATMMSNPYFHAGAGLYSLTMLAVVGRYGAKTVTALLKRKFVISMETTSRDASYEWLMQWLSRHPTFSFQQLSVMSHNVTIHANEETTANCSFVPCPNIPHWLLHNGWPIMVYRKRQVERAAGSDVLEMLEMSTLGVGSTVMRDILAEARLQAVRRDSDRTVIYHNGGGRWMRNQEDNRSRRSLSSVILEGNAREHLVDDVKLFLDSKAYYQNLGVPYRRGYLLHGPPGCGKSSLVLALAGELRLAICLLSLSNRNVDDEALNNLLNSAPLRSIVLLEDIDRAFSQDCRVTMSGLLNALDGVAAQEGRLVFMTTNHVHKLDAALIRPGRADLKLEIGLMSKKQCEVLFYKFFPDAPPELAHEFSRKLPAMQISVAQVQSHLFVHRKSAAGAVAALPAFLEDVEAFESRIERARDIARKAQLVKPPPLLPL